LAAAFAATAWSAFRRPRWLVAFAAAAGTMLVCDAWFDIVTCTGGGERLEAFAEAAFAELPLAALCAYIVLEPERFGARCGKSAHPRVARRLAALRPHGDGAERSESRRRDRHA
jgi:hypothetical protein